MLNTNEDIAKMKVDGDPTSLEVLIYAHKNEVGGPEDSIFQNNAHVILYANDGEPIESIALANEISTDIISESNTIEGSKHKLKQTDSFTVYSKTNPTKFFDKNPILYTIGKPIDPTDPDQSIFIARNTIPAEINQMIGEQNVAAYQSALEMISELTNPTTLELVDIKVINNLSNANVRPVLSKKIFNPKTLKIWADKSWGMQKILAKGVVNNQFDELSFTLPKDENWGLFKFTPVSTISKLTGFSDTNDLNMSLPYVAGKAFVSKGKLRQLIINTKQPDSWRTSLWRLFLSILELTKAFSNNFSEYTHVNSKTEKLEIDPDEKIGGLKLGLLPSTTNAISAIDGRIENWKQSYPKAIDTSEFKVFKQMVLMLTPFIQSSLALGGGLNQANKIYKIFYFDLLTTVHKGMANDANGDIEVKIKSSYFDIADDGKLSLKDQFKQISKFQALDIDGWAAMAELPNQIKTMNRIGKPGDIDPAGEALTKYFIYVKSIDQKRLQELYGNYENTTTIGGKDVSLTWTANESIVHRESETSDKAKKQLEEEITKQYTNFSEHEIYTKFVKGNLPSNQTLIYVNNTPKITNPRLENFVFSEANWVEWITIGNNRPVGKHKYGYNIDFDFKFDYEVHQVGEIGELKLTSQNALIDKAGMRNLSLYLEPGETKTKYEFDLTKNQVDYLTQITLSGIFGNEFDLELIGEDEDGNPASIKLNSLEFASKYDETQTKTRVNL